ncbi:hypothetical protein FRC14_004852 [Serendipita sp. 396]|nr:hypothetical protein FRC14_004852 [Serendipita sp. 396]KAG8866406.1 hypothetical protein FRC20_008634 [Serendipita sp. 405]
MPIRTLPLEIWREILEWLYADGEIPSRNHALVSKQWKHLLLTLPTLWRKVEVDTTSPGKPEVIHDRLERRLHHAKKTTLDVVLSNTLRTLDFTQRHYLDLLKTLAKLGPIEQWRSLFISDDQVGNGTPLHTIFVGSFTSLRALIVHGYAYSPGANINASGPFTGSSSGLFEVIVRSKPCLQYLGFNTSHIPFELEPLLRLPSISTFSVTMYSINNISYESFPKLREITINTEQSFATSQTLSKIPSQINVTILRFMSKIAKTTLLKDIKVLHIDQFSDLRQNDGPLDLPALHTLRIRPGEPNLLRYFKAPQVQVLSLLKAHNQVEYAVSEQVRRMFQASIQASIVSLFQTDKHLLAIYPVTLTMDLEKITDGTLVAMLEAWPQLKHLYLVLDKHFDCFGVFSKRFMDTKSPFCPKLEVLHMVVWWNKDSENWQRWHEVAKTMMRTRKGGSLESIIWKNNWFDVESLTGETYN